MNIQNGISIRSVGVKPGAYYFSLNDFRKSKSKKKCSIKESKEKCFAEIFSECIKDRLEVAGAYENGATRK